MNEERCLIKTITKRRKNWIGHMMRGDGLLRDMLEGRMLGKKRTGKPREGMISDLKKAMSAPKEGVSDLEKKQKRKGINDKRNKRIKEKRE